MKTGRFHAPLLGLLLLTVSGPALSQAVTGRAFEDRNGNGVRDAGEPLLAGVEVELYGTRDVGGAFDATVFTEADGAYAFSPGSGCYVLLPRDPSGWRMTSPRADLFPEMTPGYTFPVGKPRFGKLDHGITNLKAGTFRFSAMGDSIAWNWNSCFYTESFWYSKRVRDRIACAAPSAVVTLDSAAVKGEHTDDLLVDDTDDLNNVFRIIEIQPELVTVSMIGNDLLDVDPPSSPTQEQINRAVAEVLDARQNLQEALSSLITEIPGADVALNTLYDNLAYNCNTGNTSEFHRTWIPIVDRILRDLAWGQVRRASVSEVAADFAQENQVGACTGFDGMICRDFLQTDNIHPNNNGYTILREKVWEGTGGVNLGPKDALGRPSIADVDHGFLRRVRRLLPTSWEVRDGASVADPVGALSDEDQGLPARIGLGIGAEELRLSSFPDWYDEVQIVKVLAGVRYRTTGTVSDDFYRMEASVTGQFRPPIGHPYLPTSWNFYTPIVGGGGPNNPPENPDFPAVKLLARPSVPSYREVTATLTKNPALPTGASDYEWPAVTHEDLATTAIRVLSAPVARTVGDAYQVELDAAWLDLFGWEKPRPEQVLNLRVDRLADGTLEASFDPLAGATRYNLYFGRLATVGLGVYDHGGQAPAPPLCAASTLDAGGGRLKIVVPFAAQPSGDAYLLVTAHVNDVESPSTVRSDGAEADRSQSTCR